MEIETNGDSLNHDKSFITIDFCQQNLSVVEKIVTLHGRQQKHGPGWYAVLAL